MSNDYYYDRLLDLGEKSFVELLRASMPSVAKGHIESRLTQTQNRLQAIALKGWRADGGMTPKESQERDRLLSLESILKNMHR